VSADGLALDRLDPERALEVLRYEGLSTGQPREPHRHDYHELIWIREVEGTHLIDGEEVPARPGTITLIGRGAVHVFRESKALTGAVVRFGPEALFGGQAERAAPAWMFAGRTGRVIEVPEDERDALDAAIGALQAEDARPAHECSAELERHLLAVVLLWTERWYDAARRERPPADDREIELYRRFTTRLEDDFPAHHDAGHYADALGVPAAALSRALAQITGRSTKELVTDRVMVEAARLLRFTHRSVGEVAFAVGFADPLYFSRAFKRHTGTSPMAYRERAAGRRPEEAAPAGATHA